MTPKLFYCLFVFHYNECTIRLWDFRMEDCQSCLIPHIFNLCCQYYKDNCADQFYILKVDIRSFEIPSGRSFIKTKTSRVKKKKLSTEIENLLFWNVTTYVIVNSIFDKCPEIVITSITAKPYTLWKSLLHWICSKFYDFFYLWPHEGC